MYIHFHVIERKWIVWDKCDGQEQVEEDNTEQRPHYNTRKI